MGGFNQGRSMYQQQPQRGPFPGYGTGGFPAQNMGYNMNSMGNPMMYGNPQGRGRGRGPSRNGGYQRGPRGYQNNQMMTPGGPAPASTIGGPPLAASSPTWADHSMLPHSPRLTLSSRSR